MKKITILGLLGILSLPNCKKGEENTIFKTETTPTIEAQTATRGTEPNNGTPLSAAQMETLRPQIKKEAERCANALLTLDFKTYLPYLPKNLLEVMGGEESAKQLITQGMTEMKKEGGKFQSVTIGTPTSPQKYGEILTSLVPQEIKMKIPQGQLAITSHMLAISEDRGATWAFIDTGSVKGKALSMLYPELDGKIQIPAGETKLGN